MVKTGSATKLMVLSGSHFNVLCNFRIMVWRTRSYSFKTFNEAQEYIDEVQKEIDAGEYDECAWIDSEPTEYEFGKVISCSCG